VRSKTLASRAPIVGNTGGSAPSKVAPLTAPARTVTLTLLAGTSLRLVRVTKTLNISPVRMTPGTTNETSK
jgi:hypothetical protein